MIDPIKTQLTCAPIRKSRFPAAVAIICLGLGVTAGADCQAAPHKLLVFPKESTSWFSHTSIAAGIKMFQKMAVEKGFEIDVSTDSGLFTDQNLKQYDAIVFLNTSGDVLNESQKSAFQNFMRSGKGWLGTHCADNTLNDWPWYHQMVGSCWKSDKWQDNLPLVIVDTHHPSVKGLPERWPVNEQYRKSTWLFNESTPGYHVIIKVDPGFFEGHVGEGKDDWSNQSFIPYVYTHEFEGGRVWYGGMGHAGATFEDPNWVRIIGWGVDYAFGRFVSSQPGRK